MLDSLKVTDLAALATMYSTKKDSMTILVQTYMWHQTTSIETLLDSRATHNFINKHAVKKLELGMRTLPQKLQVNNVDSTLNQEGNITQYCNLWLSQGETAVRMGFYIANLGKD